jgi:phosphoglycolate phosphatase
MTLERPQYVIFDMDGTTVRHVNPLLLSALEWLDNMIYAVMRIFKRRKKVVDVSRHPVAPRGLLVHRALHKFRRKSVDKIVQPCPGIYTLLDYLQSQNICLALASNSLGKGYGHDILEKFDLAKYFEVELFAEDVQKSKPHPDGILRVLNSLENQPKPNDIVWHIGDRRKDVKATLAADKLSDCHIIPFAYGIDATIEILKNKIGNDHIIVSYLDFQQTLRELFVDDK